jgi:hypothetical protein
MGDRRALLTLDLQLPDVSTFLALFLAPHNMLGLALSLLAGRVYLASWSRHGRSLPLLVGLMVLGLGAVHPFSLVTLCVVISAHLVLTWLREGCIPGATLWCVAAVFLAAGPFLVYSWLIFSADPFWGVAYGQQNITPSPPPAFLALALAPILILAAVGLPSFLRGATRERTLVVTWILVSLASMYAPVGYQRRFAFGVHPMLALVAVAGAGRIWAVARGNGEGPSRRHPLLSLTVFLALFASTTYSYGIRVQMASRPEELVRQAGAFHPVSLVDAAQWLTTAMEPGDAILSEALTGNYLATVVPGRVFLGHPIATLNFGQKEITVRRFYLRADDPDATLQLLNSNGVRYVVYGPYERAVVASQPPSRPYLRLAYATPDVLIFEVLRDGGVEEQADGDQ